VTPNKGPIEVSNDIGTVAARFRLEGSLCEWSDTRYARLREVCDEGG
jgi:hypothetical protein